MHHAPAVTCTSCARSWHSDTMLEGLALLGECPRCGGRLRFNRLPDERRFERTAEPIEPHLVLGRPRPDRRS